MLGFSQQVKLKVCLPVRRIRCADVENGVGVEGLLGECGDGPEHLYTECLVVGGFALVDVAGWGRLPLVENLETAGFGQAQGLGSFAQGVVAEKVLVELGESWGQREFIFINQRRSLLVQKLVNRDLVDFMTQIVAFRPCCLIEFFLNLIDLHADPTHILNLNDPLRFPFLSKLPCVACVACAAWLDQLPQLCLDFLNAVLESERIVWSDKGRLGVWGLDRVHQQ